MQTLQITFLITLAAFYGAYFIKMLLLRRSGISGDILGKGSKPKNAATVEAALKSTTVIGALTQLGSVILSQHALHGHAAPQIIGQPLAAVGIVFFICSVTVMRDNWRAGFDKHQNTSLVTSGIYNISRNPAFVGFDLLYIGCAVTFPNVLNIIVTVIALFLFHCQILGEEKYLSESFGHEYFIYKSSVRRYL